MACIAVRTSVIALLWTTVFLTVQANVFLGRSPEQLPSTELTKEVQHAILSELETVLGGQQKSFASRRLTKIEDALRPLYVALPKNEYGKLCHAASSYALHRLFVQRHGWSVKGLQSETKALAAWNSASPTALFKSGQVSEDVRGTFEERVAKEGLGLHELAALAATLEHFVHKESMARLRLAYKAHGVEEDDAMSMTEAEDVMDSYMVLYLLSFMLGGNLEATPEQVQSLRKNVGQIYPAWDGTVEFLREVKDSVITKREQLYFSDVATVIEEAGERYGTWQDKECRELKDELMAHEDKGPAGAGRVRLTDFYKLAVEGGRSQFSESVSFLRQQGALDESDPTNPRVIITNYISSPSNCVASSSFFSVCCADECEGLFQHLERSIAAPEAEPSQIIEVISALGSHTVARDRTLSSWLQQRLQDIADHHGGTVPLHGRLFTQWMHFAYPRECSYPHAAGTMQGQRPEDVFSLENMMSLEAAATEEQMREHIEAYSNRTDHETAGHEESSSMWSMQEELVVSRPIQPSATRWRGTTSLIFRCLAFLALVAFTIMGLTRRAAAGNEMGSGNSHKYYV